VAAFGGLQGVPSLRLPGIDFLSLARSYGCPATRVTASGELREVIRAAAAGAQPVLIEVVVDPAVPPLLPSPA
jgi:benzoylformate decarboxylase